MNSKIHLKLGGVEIDYEGENAFITDGLVKTIDEVLELVASQGDMLSDVASAKHRLDSAVEENVPAGVTGSNGEILATSSIASKLDVKTGPDLIMAAVAHFAFSHGKMSITRDELRREMQSATEYYRDTMNKNLTAYLNRLVKAGKLNRLAEGSYALSKTSRTEIKSKLAGQGIPF